jgi:hypothetical protein
MSGPKPLKRNSTSMSNKTGFQRLTLKKDIRFGIDSFHRQKGGTGYRRAKEKERDDVQKSQETAA